MGTGFSSVGRVAVITGGASGIGLAVALRCAELRMRICLADVNEANLLSAREKVIRDGSLPADHVMAIKTDVSKWESVNELANVVFERWGEVCFLFNNAGIGIGKNWDHKQAMWDVDNVEWRRTFDINTMGVFHGIKAFLPRMMQQDAKKQCFVVNTASFAGLLNAYMSGSPYTVSKHGVTLMTEHLQKDLRERKAHISAHALCPGMIRTGLLTNSARQAKWSAQEQEQALGSLKSTLERFSVDVSDCVKLIEQGLRDELFYIIVPDKSTTLVKLRLLVRLRAADIVDQKRPLSHTIRDDRSKAVIREIMAEEKTRARL